MSEIHESVLVMNRSITVEAEIPLPVRAAEPLAVQGLIRAQLVGVEVKYEYKLTTVDALSDVEAHGLSGANDLKNRRKQMKKEMTQLFNEGWDVHLTFPAHDEQYLVFRRPRG